MRKSFIALTLLILSSQVLFGKDVTDLLKSAVLVKCEECSGIGSGTLFTREGEVYIITAEHIFDECHLHSKPSKKVMIVEHTGDDGFKIGKTEYEVELLETNHELDIALLRVPGWKFKPEIKFYLGKKPPLPGEDIIHIGSPFGTAFSNSVFKGVVAYLNRSIVLHSLTPSGFVDEKIERDQTDIDPKPGCSGGGVYLQDTHEFIGIMVVNARGTGLYVPIRKILVWAKEKGYLWLFDPSVKKEEKKDIPEVPKVEIPEFPMIPDDFFKDLKRD